jgi:hypothetical protein
MARRQAFRNMALIGMPGAGKSTVGVLLAKHWALAFTDTDLLIQTGEGRHLAQIIGRLGIEGFCDLESRYLEGLAETSGVIATGGSVGTGPALPALCRPCRRLRRSHPGTGGAADHGDPWSGRCGGFSFLGPCRPQRRRADGPERLTRSLSLHR